MPGSSVTITGPVQRFPSKGGWHYVSIPPEKWQILKQFRTASTLPVVVHIGSHQISTTIMSMGEGNWFVALKADIRNKATINEGDTVTLTISPDETRL